MAEPQPSKLAMPVRSRSPALREAPAQPGGLPPAAARRRHIWPNRAPRVPLRCPCAHADERPHGGLGTFAGTLPGIPHNQALADRVAHLESPGGQPPHPPESAPLAAHDARANRDRHRRPLRPRTRLSGTSPRSKWTCGVVPGSTRTPATFGWMCTRRAGWSSDPWSCSRARCDHTTLLRQHICPTFGATALNRISLASVRTWHASLRQQGIGQVTVAKACRLLKAILSTTVEDDLIPRKTVPAEGGRGRAQR